MSFVASARVVASLTLLSRIAGLARDAVCSRVFGAGPQWSAFALAFLIPNLFRRLFGEGALAAAFVPMYAQLQKRDSELAARFASATIASLLLLLGALTLLGELALFFLLRATPLGESGAMTLRLMMVMLPFMPLVCATATLGGMLQTHGRFAPTAAAPVLLNICMIAAASLWSWRLGRSLEETAFAVAVAVVLAGAAQTLWSFAALRGFASWTTLLTGAAPPLKKLVRRMGPVLIGLGALQINTLLDGVIAGWPVLFGPSIHLPMLGVKAYPLDESSLSILFFAQRLHQFPLGVFGIAIATAVFPMLSTLADEPDRFHATLRRGVRLSLFIGLPASVGLIAVRSDLAAVALGGGRFNEEDVRRVAWVLLGYAPAIWASMLTHLFTRAFYAQGDTSTPMRVSIITVTANLLLNITLIWPLHEAGLAWSTSLCAIGQCLALAILFNRRSTASLMDHPLRSSALWTLALTIVMGACLFALSSPISALSLHIGGWTGRLTALLLSAGVGVGVYALGARWSGRPELSWILKRE